MAKLGNAENAKLNGEWGIHVGRGGRTRQFMKKQTSKIRRRVAKAEANAYDAA